jgi:hypothetical protein
MAEAVKELYGRLGSVIESIEPRNERARTWLDKLIFRCLENSRRDLDKFANAASVQSLNYDLEIVLLIQGDDVKQKPLYAEAERLLMELEATASESQKLYSLGLNQPPRS